MADKDAPQRSPQRSDSGDAAIGFRTTEPLVTVFEDAALYGDLLYHDPHANFSAETLSGEDPVAGFAELVGRDLDQDAKSESARFAHFATALSWLPDHAQEVSEEPQSYEDDSDTASSSHAAQDALAAGGMHGLSSKQIVNVLQEEFGELTEDGEEEWLVSEADVAYFQDVTILGVFHLTTHRITFHASLFSTRPDLAASQQIIKAGPATVHFKGLRPQRKIWLELTSDMITVYPSSRDEDRIRPLRTLLLSRVREVLPFDPANPRAMRLNLDIYRVAATYIEFSTEESAEEWRKEIQGAIYLYRHMRRAATDHPESELDNEGIRMSIPLTEILDFRIEDSFVEFASILKLALAESDDRSDDSGSSSESLTRSGGHERPRMLKFGALKRVFSWKDVPYYIGVAKARRTDSDDLLPGGRPPIVIDLGPLTFVDDTARLPVAFGDVKKTKEAKVRDMLGFSPTEEVWIIRARVRRGILCIGYLAVAAHCVGFWAPAAKGPGTMYRIPTSTIRLARAPERRFFAARGLLLEIMGRSDLAFIFLCETARDEALRRINYAVKRERDAVRVEKAKDMRPVPLSPRHSSSTVNGEKARAELEGMGTPPLRSPTAVLAPLSRATSVAMASRIPALAKQGLPKVLNVPKRTLIYSEKKHYVCLTIGSRGDVQPYIALCLGLKAEGHRTTIVTHEEFKTWVEGFGIEHRTAGGDPGALMKLSVEHKMFSPQFFKESLGNFRGWLDELLKDAWAACQGAEVLLESPSAMAGVHIAEALGIPYFRTFTMPWTRTKAFPHAFMSPPVDSPTANVASYVLFDNVFWAATSGQINRWRRDMLGLEATDMGHMAQSKIPFIYNFSQAVVPKPLDWSDATVISGYWFLDNPNPDWTPPEGLIDFMEKARREKKSLVYVGFGSITVPDPKAVTDAITQAVVKSGVRAIISKGWSARMQMPTEKDGDIAMPEECFVLDQVPHDWLFPQVDAVLHHGGAGTTGASLRAGIPTLIKPWFGDQYFWSSAVHNIGAGMRVTLRVNALAAALTKATTDKVMKERAALIGQRIREEDGVREAIQSIYTYMHRASTDRTTL